MHDGDAPRPLSPLAQTIRERALTYPEAHEDHPWGEHALKVRGKVFVFLSGGAQPGATHVSMKLPLSGKHALELPFCTPTGYGLGKHGWVSARFASDADIPLDLVLGWMDESFRAVAPKTVTRKLEAP